MIGLQFMNDNRIEWASPLSHYLLHKKEMDSAIQRVLESGFYVLGPEVEQFEAELAEAVQCRYAVGVASGTDAICLVLMAAGIGPGDEVITVSHTAVATVAAIRMVGATPVFADIDPGSRTIDIRYAEALVTTRTRALVPVHIYGHPADMSGIAALAEKYNLAVVEDCAQAQGAYWQGRPVGSIGIAGCFSFYPTKNLGAIGDGGAVVTNDEALALRIRSLRQYGWRDRYISSEEGRNSRLDEIQAAILRCGLASLPEAVDRRRGIADLYDDGLSAARISVPLVAQGVSHAYHLYVIESERRDDLKAYLDSHGIGSAIHYPLPVHLQPAYKRYADEPLAATELLAGKILSLPMYPELTDEAVMRVIQTCQEFE